jgi:hypothetical protein
MEYYSAIKKKPGTVAHAYKLSYLGARDEEDCGLKPAWAKSTGDPHLNK